MEQMQLKLVLDLEAFVRQELLLGGVPQLSAVYDVAQSVQDSKVQLLRMGKFSGDIAKITV